MAPFAKTLRESSPAHYSQFYIHYDGCKRLIEYLLEVQKAWKSGELMPSGMSTVLQRKIVETLQSVLSLSLPNLTHNLVLQLAFQSIFTESIMGEVSGVNQFVVLRYQSIQEGIRCVCARLHDVIETEAAYNEWKNKKRNGELWSEKMTSEKQQVLCLLPNSDTSKQFESADQYENWRDQELEKCEFLLRIQSAETLHLDQFIRLNYKAILRLTSLFDKVASVSVSPWMIASLSKETFANVNLDRLLICVCVGWNKFRVAKSRRQGLQDSTSTWVPPETFVRRTTKYWIPIDQIVRVKLSILEHMPYLIYGTSIDAMETIVDPYSNSGECRSNKQRIDEGQLVTSVYFDSTKGYSYYHRLNRFHGAQLLRFRWYGNNNSEPEKPIFIERKTHCEPWTGEASTKERFMIPQKYISDFMSGEKSINEIVQKISIEGSMSLEHKRLKNMLRLGQEVQSFISEKNLTPVIRTSYRRSAFQLATSNEVRFSIDTNLSMVDEFVVSSQSLKKEHWCRLGEEILGKNEVIHFPYAILEVKLQTDKEPSWVTDILYASNAIMVYKFSKFLHGMASLHPEIVTDFEVPHWLLHRSNEKQKEHKPVLVTPPKLNEANEFLSKSVATLKDSSSPSSEMWMMPINWAIHARMVAQKAILSLFEFRPEQENSNLQEDRCKMGSLIGSEMSRFSDSRRFKSSMIHSSAEKDPHLLMRMTLDWSQPAKAENSAEIVFDRSLNLLKLDPKSFFASERMFLHYSQKALYLGFLGAMLTTWKSSNVTRVIGIILSGASILVLCISYVVFISRCTRIGRRLSKTTTSRKERLDSFYAPIFIFLVMISTIIISFSILTVKPHKPLNFSLVSTRDYMRLLSL